MMTGQPVSEEFLRSNLEAEEEDAAESIVPAISSAVEAAEDSTATAEHVRVLIEDCTKLLVPDPEAVVGAWGLIDNDPASGDLRQEDMDIIFLLTKVRGF